MYINVTCPCCWQPASPPGGGKGRSSVRSHYHSGTVLADSVVVVKAGIRRVRDLSQPVRLIFRQDKKVNLFLALFLDYYSALISFWRRFDVSEGRSSLCVLAGDIPGWQDRWASKRKTHQRVWGFYDSVRVCLQDFGAQRVAIPTWLKLRSFAAATTWASLLYLW